MNDNDTIIKLIKEKLNITDLPQDNNSMRDIIMNEVVEFLEIYENSRNNWAISIEERQDKFEERQDKYENSRNNWAISIEKRLISIKKRQDKYEVKQMSSENVIDY